MSSKFIFISLPTCTAQARFNQEQEPVNAIRALTNRGPPGAAATLAGSVPGVLAGANACAKLQLADRIVTNLGAADDVLAAVRTFVAAERNFNPFAVSIPSICSDIDLPVTRELRGIVPFIVPVVVGSDIENANAALSTQDHFNSISCSVADVVAENGFTNFTAQGSDDSSGVAPIGNGINNNGGKNDNYEESVSGGLALETVTVGVTITSIPAGCAVTPVIPPINEAVEESDTNSRKPLDFGSCSDPTIKFAVGLDGRMGQRSHLIIVLNLATARRSASESSRISFAGSQSPSAVPPPAH